MSGIMQAIIGTGKSAVQFRAAVQLVNQTSDANRTLTLNTVSPGDMLVAMTANRQGTAPALLSGYTNIRNADSADSRSLRVQFKIATSTSETISWNGAYGFLASFRFATRIGQVTGVNSTGTLNNPFPLADITGLNTSGVGFILSGYYLANGWSNATGGYSILNGDTDGFAAGKSNNTSSFIFSATADNTPGNLSPNSFTIELLP